VLTEWDATRTGIIDALRALAREAESNDVVTLYFSGHGGRLPEAGERRFLVPRDRSLLDGEQFTDLLRDIPARRLLVLLDCCFAGGVHVEHGAKAPEAKATPVPFDVQELRRQGVGTVVLSSSRGDEYSWTGLHYSIFTQVVIDALCGADTARQDGYVRVTDLAMHVARWVPTLTDNKQHPQLHLEAADNYPVAYYAAGSKAPLAKPRWLVDAVTGPAPVIRQTITDSAAHPAASLSLASAIRDLCDLFVKADLTRPEARRIALGSGVDAATVSWTENQLLFWQTVLDRAHTSWCMEELFSAADPVFGKNPDWDTAKRAYRASYGPDSRRRSAEAKGVTPVDLSLYKRHLQILKDALGHVLPSIFHDPRIRATRLNAASNALLSVGPVIKVLSAAADKETQQPLQHKLQRMEDLLQRRYEAVSEKLSALDNVRSEGAAVKPCKDLAIEAAALLAVYEQAISYIT
jgi:hypothetical protein